MPRHHESTGKENSQSLVTSLGLDGKTFSPGLTVVRELFVLTSLFIERDYRRLAFSYPGPDSRELRPQGRVTEKRQIPSQKFAADFETNDLFKMAVGCGDTVLMIAPNRKAEARRVFQQGYRAQQSGDYDLAVDLYIKSVALSPTAEVHILLGSAFRALGKIDRAIEECTRAIAIDSECGDAYNDIGEYLFDLQTL